MPTSDVLKRVRSTGKITADDALEVRRAVYGGDTKIQSSEIEAMFQIDEAAQSADVTWTQLLGEAAADYLVYQEPPEGYLSQANADWLVERIVKDGMVKTPREFEMLVHLLDQARSAPGSLATLAIRQVQFASLEGKGPLAEVNPKGYVCKADVDMLRRILYAFGGDGGIAVTREEAAALFDLNDAAAGSANDPEWDDLFVKAIASFTMAPSGYKAPPREVALEKEHWLDEAAGSVGGFLGEMVAQGVRGVVEAYRTSKEEKRADRIAAQIGDIETSEVVTENEAAWLAERIGGDGGEMNKNEKALLRFIRDELPNVHPSLKPLIEKAA